MLTTPIFKSDGTKSGTLNLPEQLFAAKVNPQLMAQAVRVFLSNQRQAHAKSKTRGEINRTTRKWYRQKGTGRARHGAQSAPLFVGGAKAHGPRGLQNYHMHMPQKMRRAALASALTSKLQDGQIIVVDGLEKLEAKTKKAALTLFNLKLVTRPKLTLITPSKIENITRAFRNLPTVNLESAHQLHTYLVLNGGTLIFTKDAVNKLEETFATKAQKSLDSKQSTASEISQSNTTQTLTDQQTATRKKTTPKTTQKSQTSKSSTFKNINITKISTVKTKSKPKSATKNPTKSKTLKVKSIKKSK